MYRIEELELRLRFFRHATIALGLALLLVVAALVSVALRGPRRYLVVLDSFGTARQVEPLEGLGQLDRRFVVAELRRLVTDVRSVSGDPAIDGIRLAQGLDLLSASVRREVMHDLRATEAPRRREVEVVAVHQLETAGRYLVRWRETTFEGIAETGKGELWEAYLTTSFQPDLDEDELFSNPLGLLITHLSWTRLGSNEKEKLS
jgi:type IV secretion system protein VirB5